MQHTAGEVVNVLRLVVLVHAIIFKSILLDSAGGDEGNLLTFTKHGVTVSFISRFLKPLLLDLELVFRYRSFSG